MRQTIRRQVEAPATPLRAILLELRVVSVLLLGGAMNNLVCLALAVPLVACTTSPHPDDPAYAQGGGKADSSWCHVNFDSVEGTNIRVDYVMTDKQTDSEYTRSASPVWLNVKRADLTSAHGVRVWVGDEGYSSDEGYSAAAEYGSFFPGPDAQLDLYRSEDATRFTGQLPGSLAISEYAEGDDQATIHAHQFAVVIDGAWQTDPISGTHNFVAPDLGSCSN